MSAPAREHVASSFPSQISEHRTRLLIRANQVLSVVSPEEAAEPTIVPQLAGLLNASLDALKIAEEELIRERAEADATRDRLEGELELSQAMFQFAPTALLITTPHAIMRDLNIAAEALFGRTSRHLSGKSLTDMILIGVTRVAFKASLGVVLETGRATGWRFTLERATRAPIEVVATVTMVESAALYGGGHFYWQIAAA